MVKNNKRLAFTLIELIFAIVIISIAVVSLPVMTKITERGIESNILQEAIFASSAELMGVSSGYWDSRSIDDFSVNNMSRVIDINASNPIIRCDNNSSSIRFRLRLGHIEQPLHRRCLDSNTSTGLNTAAADTLQAGKNIVNANASIFNAPLAQGQGYKDTYTSSMQIITHGNIKYITATVSNTDGPITRLKMQSANIGEIDYYKRRL